MKKQPLPKKGSEFTGWAVYNWGICYQKVFRTREEAKKYCIDEGNVFDEEHKRFRKPKDWNEIKGHMAVIKVKCTVI